MGRPTWPDEAGRSRFGQSSSIRSVCLAQHLSGPNERGRGRDALKFERREEGGRPAPDADIVFADILKNIERFRARQSLGFGDSRAEPLPRDHRGDCVEGILFVTASADQSGTNAGVETDLFVDGSGIRLECAGMPAFGFAEHRADQAVEQVDGLVG